MVHAQLQAFEEYQPVMEPRPGMQVVAEIVTRSAVDGSESVQHRLGTLRSAENDIAIVVPKEGPWVVACLKDFTDTKGNAVSTQLYEVDPLELQ